KRPVTFEKGIEDTIEKPVTFEISGEIKER
ncbi:hypothetical protein A2U01_0013934, partial [Trifolium medium]|nr:hypothetical protein [Trifolium medium]